MGGVVSGMFALPEIRLLELVSLVPEPKYRVTLPHHGFQDARARKFSPAVLQCRPVSVGGLSTGLGCGHTHGFVKPFPSLR